MNPIYRQYPIDEEEVLPLVAFLKSETERDEPDNKTAMINFLLYGIGGAVVLLVLFDVLWNKRFRGVREPMVRDSYHRASLR
jgi:multisubunit Na+/H+ antiporter MnhB subunit